MPTITPVAGPVINTPASTTVRTPTQLKVIENLNKVMTSNAGQSQETPVVDPNKVSVEELGAVKTAESRQNDISVESSATTASEEASATADTEVKAEPAKAEDPLSQYAVFARKEKALRARDQQLRAREESLRAREEALKPAATSSTPSIDPSKFVSREELAKNPLQVLSDMGLTYDQLTNLAINAPTQEEMQRRTYESKIEAELKQIKEAQEQTRKFYEEQQNQSYKQAVRQIKQDAESLIESSPEFETIRATNSIDDVVELIEQTFKEENRLLSVEEASKAVEDYLVEEATRLAKLSKIQQRLRPAQASPKKQEPASQPAQTLKTLTNSVSSSRPLTAKERAILAFKGELK